MTDIGKHPMAITPEEAKMYQDDELSMLLDKVIERVNHRPKNARGANPVRVTFREALNAGIWYSEEDRRVTEHIKWRVVDVYVDAGWAVELGPKSDPDSYWSFEWTQTDAPTSERATVQPWSPQS